MHLVDSAQLTESVLAWINCADWDAMRGYIGENSSSLLTDEAEAIIEHLIDANPAAIRGPECLQLLRAARVHGVDDAYAASHERLQATHLTHILREWLSAHLSVAKLFDPIDRREFRPRAG